MQTLFICTKSLENAYDNGWFSKTKPWYGSVAAETKKGFLGVTDKKDGYSFVYPFGWQVVVTTVLF